MTKATVLELDEVIRRHAWGLLRKRSNFLRRLLLDENDYNCEIDWTALTFDHHTSKFEFRPDERTFHTDFGTIKTGTRWVPLHACDFENRSDTKQSHTFRGNRQTTTWVACELSECYTIANAVDVSLNIPSKFLHLRAGRDTSLKISKVKGNVIKEILEWEVNSQVEVMPSWRAHAQLLARETCYIIDFEVRTTLTLPTGVLPVFFKRRSDNTLAFEVKVEDFEEAFKSEQEGGALKEHESPLVHTLMQTTIDQEGKGQSSSKLQLLTRGTSVCVAWSDQKVDIKTFPLSVSDGDDNDVQSDNKYLAQV